MEQSLPIHDLFIRSLRFDRKEDHQRMVLLRFEDHLLRRFGTLELLRLEAHSTTPLCVREVADEVWALVEGKVEFIWWDRRPASPTENQTYRLTTAEPTLVLVPFGVAFGVRVTESSCTMIRAATHLYEEHAGDRTLAWESLP
jgi:hypothetical protein